MSQSQWLRQTISDPRRGFVKLLMKRINFILSDLKKGRSTHPFTLVVCRDYDPAKVRL